MAGRSAVCRIPLLLVFVALDGFWANTSAAIPIRVVTIGDSITLGSSSAPEGPGWVELLAERFSATHDFINVAKGGSSSLDWTGLNGGPNYFDIFALPELPADLVMIMLGTIDASGYGEIVPVSVEQYRTALELLVARSLLAGANEVVLTGPPPVWWLGPGAVRIFEFQGVVAEICSATAHVRCGPDVYGLLDVETDFAFEDVHPNAAGHEKIAAAFAEYVPEPSTATLLGGGLLAIGLCRRRARGGRIR